MTDRLSHLEAQIREALCPNWGVQPHGGCEYCARNEDAINAVSDLLAVARAAQRVKATRPRLEWNDATVRSQLLADLFVALARLEAGEQGCHTEPSK